MAIQRFDLNGNSLVDSPHGMYVLHMDHRGAVAALEKRIDQLQFLVSGAAPAAERLTNAFEESQQLVGELRNSLLGVLTWMTNVNAKPTHEMVAGVFSALAKAGVPKEDLDDAAVACLRGAARAKELDDDGVRDMLARHGVTY